MEETIKDGNGSKPTESKHHSLVPTYSLNERVFISEGKGKLYEASILKHNFKPGSDLSNGSFLYYIHYIGWNSRYDRWVSESEIVKKTQDSNLKAEQTKQEAKRVLKELSLASSKKRKSTKSENSKHETLRKKRKENNSNHSESNNNQLEPKALFPYNINLPLTLKIILIDDDQVMRKSKNGLGLDDGNGEEKSLLNAVYLLHTLPATQSIKKVLINFVRYMKNGSNQKKGKKSENETYTEETLLPSLIRLFNIALPICLLYPSERVQYKQTFLDNANCNLEPHEIYPCQHLLRLFTKLHLILPMLDSSSEEKTGTEIEKPFLFHLEKLINDLIFYLQVNRQKCFCIRYKESA